MKNKISVEVEGGEVAQTPDGSVLDFTGPSHEDGGIPVALPEGTEVFSDRISIDGRTMAQREKSRNRKLGKLTDLLESDPTNKLRRNTASRTKMVLDNEQEMDKSIQEMAAPILNPNTKAKTRMAGGGEVEGAGMGAMPWGQLINGLIQISTQLGQGTADEVENPLLTDTNHLRPYAGGGRVSKLKLDQNYFDPGNLSSETALTTPSQVVYDPYSLPEEVDMYPSLSDSDAFKLSKQLQGRSTSSATVVPTTEGSDLGTTAGNLIGQLGTAINTVAPLVTTLKNRQGDTPNINAYLNYGKDGLDANAAEMDYVAAQEKEANLRIRNAGNAAKLRNRNSASSISTQRALDTVTDLGIDQMNASAEAQAAQQMIQILSQKAQLENNQDAAVMAGEQNRDMKDRQDRDQFFTNLNKDLGNVGTGLQMQGRALNQQQLNEDELALMGELSKYGLGYKKVNGKLQLTKVK